MTKPLSTDQLIEEIKQLVRDGEALLTAFTDGDGMHETKERAEESLATVKERLAQLQDHFLGEARTAMDVGKTYLSDNPWKAMALAAGVGFLIGTLLSRPRSG